jgi:hypothetical protein
MRDVILGFQSVNRIHHNNRRTLTVLIESWRWQLPAQNVKAKDTCVVGGESDQPKYEKGT